MYAGVRHGARTCSSFFEEGILRSVADGGGVSPKQTALDHKPSLQSTCGQNGCITPAFSGVPNRRGPNQKWLHHPCLLGDRLFGERGQKQARVGNGKTKMPRALTPPLQPHYCSPGGGGGGR